MLPSTAKLPDYRIYFEFPFENVRLDYVGSLYTRVIYSSNKETYKSYILLFTCAATSNTHLELVTELSKSLLYALRRFVARKCLSLTFINANFKTFKTKEIKRFALKLKINWKFILVKSPWWGRCYKKLIGIMKKYLKKVAGKALLNYDELTAFINTNLTNVKYKTINIFITICHLLYGQNISRRNFMYFDAEYRKQEDTLLNRYKRLKVILK